MDYKVSTNHSLYKIYINDLIHLCLNRDEFVGFQSWVEGSDTKKYFIEYTMKGTTIISEYDFIEKWERVLQLLNTHPII